jgi:hypothetical protein
MKTTNENLVKSNAELRRAMDEFRGEQRFPGWFKIALILAVLIAFGLIISAAMAGPSTSNAPDGVWPPEAPGNAEALHGPPSPPSTSSVTAWIANLNGWWAAALIIWTYLSHKFRDIMATIRKAWPGIKSAYTAIAAHGGLGGIIHTLLYGIKDEPPKLPAEKISP